MPDGSPRLTQVRVDTVGTGVLIDTGEGHQKLRNVRRDPRVALTVPVPAGPSGYVRIRGAVRELTTDGAREQIVPTRTDRERRPFAEERSQRGPLSVRA